MENQNTNQDTIKTKFCKHCGAKIAEDAIICTSCGRQVEELKSNSSTSPNIVINNANTNSNINTNTNGVLGQGKPKNKWISIALCILLGFFGAHKFYEGKTGMGILYICTGGLCMLGVIIDLIALIFKPTTYYV